jgi:ubiquinone/menaquinone biosynthesis C-methylase UbiE
MNEVLRSGVIGFFDSHPINEDEILAKLKATGRNLDALSQVDLGEFDQDHYGGLEAVDALAKAAGIAGHHLVLDVCSGMGGPARWLAYNYGCRVTGIDFTRSRVEGANRLTARVGLAALVDFLEGDATDMPLPDSAYDVVVAQESWCHIANKAALLSEVARVLKPSGTVAFTDIVTISDLPERDESRLAGAMQMPRPTEIQEYLRELAVNRFIPFETTDLSGIWKPILTARLKMYRSLRDTTVAKFGETRYAEYDSAYSHYVGLFSAGKLGTVALH